MMKTRREKNSTCRLTRGSLAKTSNLIRSLRDDEQGKAQKTRDRKWLRTHDESEWSLNTSRMLRFGALFPELAGRSLRRMFPLW